MRCPACGVENPDGLQACVGCHDPIPAATSHDPDACLTEAIQSLPLAALNPRDVVMVSPQTPLSQVVQLLAARDIGCVLVGSPDKLLGIFSERDMLRRIGSHYNDLADEPVERFMTASPQTLALDDSVAFALNRMDVNDFRHIPIERDGQAAGIISVRDVLAFLTHQFPEFKLQQN